MKPGVIDFWDLAIPSNQVAIPFILSVTGSYRGDVTMPLNLIEQTVGAITSLVMTVSINSSRSAPTVTVFSPSVHPDNAFRVNFSGRSRGDGAVSTLAQVNGGSWWVVSQSEFWSFDAGFTADGDMIEILARDAEGRVSEAQSFVFTAPSLSLTIQSDKSLAWDVQLGRTYAVEWSTNLQHWAPLQGVAQQSGASVTVGPAATPLRIADAPAGRVVVRFNSVHEAATSTNAFFRIRSDR